MEKNDEECVVAQTSNQALSDLRDLSIHCRELLHQLSTNDDVTDGDGIEARDSMASFYIWAANMGVFREGRQSLTARLKSAPEISKLVRQLLSALEYELERTLHRVQNQEDPSSESDSDNSSDHSAISSNGHVQINHDQQGPTLHRSTNWTSIHITITNLRRLAITVRNAGAQHRRERIQRFRNLERNKQVYQLLERLARQKVDHLFPNASEVLRKRMAESIASRRARFLYLEEHQKKTSTLNELAPDLTQTSIAEEREGENIQPSFDPSGWQQQTPDLAVGAEPVVRPSILPSVVLSQTVDTRLDQKQLDLVQDKPKRAESVSSVKVSTGKFPPIPKLKPDNASFTCPYCFLVCPAEEASGKTQWIGHLIHDFEPYYCVFEDCPLPFKGTETEASWLAHMRDAHTEPEWHCWYCKSSSPNSGPFSTGEKLDEHLEKHHPEEATDSLRPTVIKHSVARKKHTLKSCPFCGGFPEEIEMQYFDRDSAPACEALEKHVRDHLISVALILAPIVTEEADDVLETEMESEAQRSGGSELDLNAVGDTYELECSNTSCDCKDAAKNSVSEWSSLEFVHPGWEMTDKLAIENIDTKWQYIKDQNTNGEEEEDLILKHFANRPEFIPPSPLDLSSEQDPLLRLQASLWDDAYDRVRKHFPALFDSFEKQLASLNLPHATDIIVENKLPQGREERRFVLWRVIQLSLNEMQNTAERSEVVMSVREMVTKVLKNTGATCLAWVGIGLWFGILWKTISKEDIDRDGIAYITSRMEWYCALPAILLDEGIASRARPFRPKATLDQLYWNICNYQIESVLRLLAVARNPPSAQTSPRPDKLAHHLASIMRDENIILSILKYLIPEETRLHLSALARAIQPMEQKIKAGDPDAWLQDDPPTDRFHDYKRHEFLRNLFVTDPRDHKTIIEDRAGNLIEESYEWNLSNEEFRRWHDDPQSRLLWIKGGPGTGKRTLTCGIIDKIRRNPNNQLVYFFCDRGDVLRNNANVILRSLLWLLLTQEPSLLQHALGRYGDIRNYNLQDDQVLSEMLNVILHYSSPNNAIIIIDAIDECGEGRDMLLDFVLKPSRVKWIISGQPCQNITMKMRDAAQMIELNLTKSNSDAFRAYIQRRAHNLASLNRWDARTRRIIEDSLISQTGGNYFWANLACRALAKGSRWEEPYTLSSLPLSPQILLKPSFRDICASEDANLLKEVLAVVSTAYRPVTFEELQVLAQSFGTLSTENQADIVSMCGNFLCVRDGVIQFVHPTAKDFLLSHARQQALPLSASDQHYTLFERSLQVLFRTLRRDMYNLRAPAFPIHKISPPKPDPLISIRYACVHWVDHLIGSSTSEELLRLLDRGRVYNFLQRNILYWLESLSLFGCLKEGFRAMDKLLNVMENLDVPRTSRLLEEILDSTDFGIIQTAPLQIYASTLVFSPDGSLLRNVFEKEMPDWFVSKHLLELDGTPSEEGITSKRVFSTSLALSSDSQWLATGSNCGVVRVWDIATGVLHWQFTGHSKRVTSVSFSKNGRQLTSASADMTVQILDLILGECIHSRRVEGDVITRLSFDPSNSSRIFTDVGPLEFSTKPLPPVDEGQSTKPLMQQGSHLEFGVSENDEWITKDGEDVLWIPKKYWGPLWCATESMVAIGCTSGSIMLMRCRSSRKKH